MTRLFGVKFPGNRIHPTALIVGNVDIGKGNYVGPHSVISGPLSIGDGNYFGANCVVGGTPHHDALSPSEHEVTDMGGAQNLGSLRIGNRNVFREYVSIHRGLTGVTEIHDDCYVMAHVNIAHDLVMRDNVKVGAGVQTGGYVRIGRGVYLGLSSSIRQFSSIGSYSMVGMGSAVISDLLPGSTVIGVPAKLLRYNEIALTRLGLSDFSWWPSYANSRARHAVPAELTRDVEDYFADVTACRLGQSQAQNFRN